MASGSSCHTWEGAGMPGHLVGVLFLYPGSLLLVHFVHVRRAHTVESVKLNLRSPHPPPQDAHCVFTGRIFFVNQWHCWEEGPPPAFAFPPGHVTHSPSSNHGNQHWSSLYLAVVRRGGREKGKREERKPKNKHTSQQLSEIAVSAVHLASLLWLTA